MVVADVNHHTLIEARSYFHGFGRVQEIFLQQEFKGVSNYEQLKEVSIQQKPLERLNAQGEVVQKLEMVKILKFSSVWQGLANLTN